MLAPASFLIRRTPQSPHGCQLIPKFKITQSTLQLNTTRQKSNFEITNIPNPTYNYALKIQSSKFIILNSKIHISTFAFHMTAAQPQSIAILKLQAPSSKIAIPNSNINKAKYNIPESKLKILNCHMSSHNPHATFKVLTFKCKLPPAPTCNFRKSQNHKRNTTYRTSSSKIPN